MEFNISIITFSTILTAILTIYNNDNIISEISRSKVFSSIVYSILLIDIIDLTCSFIYGFSRSYRSVINILDFFFYLIAPFIIMLLVYYCELYVEDNDICVKRFRMLGIITYSIYFIILVHRTMQGRLNRAINVDDCFNIKSFNSIYFLTMIIYSFIGMYIVHTKKNRMNTILIGIMRTFPLLVCTYVALTILFPEIYLLGAFSSLVIVMLYLYIENKKLLVDPLTKVLNRRAFLSRMDIIIAQHKKAVVILVSLDDFKIINDNLSSKVGDNVLIEVVNFLTRICKKNEVYRYGGDEFIILLENNRMFRVSELIRKIKDRFSKEFIVDNYSVMLSSSNAVVEMPIQANNTEELISLLEYITVKSKNTMGKGRTIYCSDFIKNEIERKNKVAHILREEVKNKGFIVMYQPIFDTSKNAFTKAEALIRLRDDELGMLSPNEFIPIAEELGLIVDIGYIVLEKVCKFLRRIEDSNIDIESISVNFSPNQMLKDSLVDNIMNIIDYYKVDPSKISIEITENFIIDRNEKVIEKMNLLHQKGIKFYLDDFGTGYSNISRVMELPFDVIKIDKTLVDNCESNSKCYHLLEGLSSAFEKADMKVLVEGVETEVQKDIIGNICYYIQGFYFARPTEEDEVIKMLGM